MLKTPQETTLLIVDDEADLRNALIFDFKRKGYKVLDAQNGVDAFNIVKKEKVDVVISDIRMPGGDGVELLKNVKAHNIKLPVVIFITGFSDLGIEDAYNEGADAVFAKPFDRKALHLAVQKAITPREELWPEDVSRAEVNFSIELSFPGFNEAVQTKALSLGRGGIFVSLADKFPSVMSTAKFKLQFSKDPKIQTIEGAGLVRWVRVKATPQYASGCGIEITHLTHESKTAFLELVEALSCSAFIPKA